jgi:Uma2 family endonuclease
MAMPLTGHFTAADLASMPDDGNRYELVRGELLVSPAPGGRHQMLVAQLLVELRLYLEPHGLARQALMAPADITFADDTVLEPDLFVADTAALLRSWKWTDVTTLSLVVEVTSRSTEHTDRTTKRDEYQRHGIPVYWIVDGDQRQVEIWTPGAKNAIIERERLTWRHPALEEECVIDLVRLFEFG